MQACFAALAGLLFGLGLIVSGMTDPARVRGFLDLAGAWNPSLMFVMGGALGVATVAFAVAATRRTTLLGTAMQLPAPSAIDRRLLLGATTFGVGWGIAGFCPGPAVASLASGRTEPLVFTAAMLAGMVIFAWLERITMKPIPS